MQSGSTPKIDDYFADLQAPNPQDMALQLEELVQQGSLSPEDAQAVLAGSSAYNGISLDPKLQQAQMDALSRLEDITSSGGLTATDRSKLNQIQTDEDTAARGSREAILQNAQSRGMGGSGLEIMSQLKNQQDSTTRKAQRDMDVAAMSEQRALDALIQQGQMAGNMQNQNFNQQSQVAGANDAISRFNAQNQQQVNMANTQARNDAQAKNMAVKQGVADSNVNTRNQAQQHNKNLIQQNYENQLKKRSGQSGIAQQNAGNAGKDSAGAANANNQNIGTALSVAAMFSDENLKKDVEKFDPSEFLDSLTGYKYKYKDPEMGSGDQVGVMAQDLEKTPAGDQMVEDTPDGKVVDYAKSGPSTFAALADIHDRLKKLEGR